MLKALAKKCISIVFNAPNPGQVIADMYYKLTGSHITLFSMFDSEYKRLAAELVNYKINEDIDVKGVVDSFDRKGLMEHYGDQVVVDEYLNKVKAYFIAKRVMILKERIGEDLNHCKILDAGDSNGVILRNLQKKGIGMNVSWDAAKNITKNGIQAICAKIDEIPLQFKSFDYVILFQTLEHLPNPIQVLRDIAKICKKKLFISIPYVPRTYIHEAFYDPGRPRYQHHIFEFCEGDFEKIITHTSFNITYKLVIDVFGNPETRQQKDMIQRFRDSHLLGGCFKKFIFYELTKAVP